MAEERPKRPRKKKDAAEEAPAAGGGGKTIIIAAAVAALMLGLGVGVGFFVGGMLSDDKETVATEGEEEAVEEEVKEDRHNIYASVGKLLANIDDNGMTRYIQAEVDIVSYEKEVIDAAQHDMPAIRNRLLLLFSSQDFNKVKTVEGREALRLATIDAVNEVLGTTPDNGIHDAFFTAFVIQ